jgi:hypothetical protein
MNSARPTLPLISARGSNNKGDAGGMISARSHHTNRSHGPASALNPDRFTKLKAVLVNNLLKLYHKKVLVLSTFPTNAATLPASRCFIAKRVFRMG